MLSNYLIKRADHSLISYEEFVAELKRLESDGLDLYIGTDSQLIKTELSIATCLCFYKAGRKESRIFYIKELVDANLFSSLRSKILKETLKSIEIAIDLDYLFNNNITLHLDVGSDSKRSKTAKFENELQILVKAQGFGCEIKPNSWASSSIADRISKI